MRRNILEKAMIYACMSSYATSSDPMDDTTYPEVVSQYLNWLMSYLILATSEP